MCYVQSFEEACENPAICGENGFESMKHSAWESPSLNTWIYVKNSSDLAWVTLKVVTISITDLQYTTEGRV